MKLFFPTNKNINMWLQRLADQTTVLQALKLGHMRSNDYSKQQKYLLTILYCPRCR